MSFVGSPSTSTRSASLPGVTLPRSRLVPRVPCAVAGRDLERLRWRQPGLDVERQLGLQGEAGNRVGAGHDRHAGAVQPADELDHLRVRALVARIGLGIGNVHAADGEVAPDVGRHMVGDRRVATAISPSRCWMKSNVASVGSITVCRLASMAMKSCTGFESKSRPATLSAGRRKRSERARLGLGRDEEVQHHLVDVLDLVEALLHDLRGAHERRHVAADAHAAAVRVGDRLAQDLLRERVVDLELRIAALRVPVDRPLRLVERADGMPNELENGLRPSRKPQGMICGISRRPAAMSSSIPASRVVVAHVAHGGHAGGEVERAVPAPHVPVHVEQAGEQHAAGGVDLVVGVARGRAGGQDLVIRPRNTYTSDAACRRRRLAVEDARVANHRHAGHRMAQSLGPIAQGLLLGGPLALFEQRAVGLPAGLDEDFAGKVGHREDARLGARW